jgi:hypothetical protein
MFTNVKSYKYLVLWARALALEKVSVPLKGIASLTMMTMGHPRQLTHSTSYPEIALQNGQHIIIYVICLKNYGLWHVYSLYIIIYIYLNIQHIPSP